MKIEREGQAPIIIGKRVTIGAFIGSIASVLAFYFPEHATPIVSGSTALIFIVQVIVANRYGVTQ